MINAVETQTFTLSKDTVQKRIGDRTATYHRLLGGLFLLDDAGQNILQSFKDGKSVSSHLFTEGARDREEELIHQLIARKILIEDKEEKKPKKDINKKINIIQLVLANACNFGCTYCFEGIQGKEMSAEDEIKKIEKSRIIAKDSIKINIENSMYASKERFEHQYSPKNRSMKPEDGVAYVESALTVARSEGVQEVMVQFFGGEPLLNWRTIKAVLERFGRGENDGMVIHYSTVTNGSLITDEVAEKFRKYQVAVCVSVDSPNSPSRPLKNGNDSMPIVMNGLKKLQQHNNRVALNAALTSATWDDFNEGIVDLAVEVGAKEIGVVVDFDPTFYSTYGTTNIVDRLWHVIQYGRQKGVVLTGYWHQIFQVMLGFDTVNYRGFKNCSAKGAQFSIEPNGSVFSCKAGSTLLGDIRDETKILNEKPYLEHASLRQQNPDFCQGCEIEGFCAGLCLGPLEKKFGSIRAVEESACDFYRGITRKHIEALQPYEIATFDLKPAQ